MKTQSKLLTICLIIMACCALPRLSVIRADDGVEGGDIEGTESLDIDLAMTPTAAAPPGATIQVSLEAEDENGTNDAKLKLETEALPPATYNVSVTLKSDGSVVALGSFTVDSQGDGEAEFATNPDDNEEAPFPANFNPLDTATISVSDANTVVLFTADLTQISTATTMIRTATVQATSGRRDPHASGTAALNAFVSGQQAKGSLHMAGHGLPPSTQLMVAVNRLNNVKKVYTDTTGRVSLIMSPNSTTGTIAPGVTLFQVNSLRLKDRFGNVLLSAGF